MHSVATDRGGLPVNVGTRVRVLEIPATALVFNTQGTQVILVGSDNKLHVQQVTVGRDFGATVDIQAGLNEGESVVEQPDVSLQNGQSVTPVEPTHATTQP